MATLNVPLDYPTISDAVAAATAGDTILVADGYAGNETVNVTVDNLTFSAPASVTGIVLNDMTGQVITLAGLSPIDINAVTASGFTAITANNAENDIAVSFRSFGGQVYAQGGDDTVTVNEVTPTSLFAYLDGGQGVDALVFDLGGSTFDWRISSTVAQANPNQFAQFNTNVQFANFETYSFTTGSGADNFNFNSATIDLDGGSNSDYFTITNCTGTIDGGSGSDILGSSSGVLGQVAVTNVENLTVGGQSVQATAATLSSFDTITYNTSSSTQLSIVLLGAGGGFSAGTKFVSGTRLNIDASNATSGVNVTATANADTIFGSNFADTLNGGDGADVFSGGLAGADQVDGGLGDDVVTAQNLGGATFTNVETLNTFQVVGSISQLASFTTITAASPTQSISMNLNGAGGTLDFGAVVAGGRSISLSGAAVTGSLNLTGTANNDAFFGSTYADTLNGGAGNDTIEGGGGVDLLNGGTGNDLFQLGGGAGTVNGGDDFDIVRSNNLGSWTFSNVEQLDVASGFVAGTIAQFNSFASITRAAVGAAIDLNLSGAGGTLDLGTRVENSHPVNVNGSKLTSALTLVASANADVIIGSKFNDSMDGGAGDDRFELSGGQDTLLGGTGDDAFRVNGAKGVIDGGADTDTVRSGNLGNYVLSNVEILDTSSVKATAAQLSAFSTITDNGSGTGEIEIYLRGAGGTVDFSGKLSSDFSLYFTADDAYASVNVRGSGSDDLIRGSAFDDTLDGGLGVDVLFGGLGDDIYYTDGDDVVAETGNAGLDIVYSSGTFTLGRYVENLVLTGAGAINGKGNDAANQITGNDAANGIDGGRGADTMTGLGGDDRYTVDDAGDIVVEASGGGVDVVKSSVSYTLVANVENLQLTGTGAINGFGNELANTIIGNDAANIINGGAGVDRLRGNGGADTFVIANTDADAILDFSHVDDTIRLEGSTFSALGLGALSAAAFKDIGVAGATVDADDRIIYNHLNGQLFYDADGNGAGARIKIATLNNFEIISHDDFVVA